MSGYSLNLMLANKSADGKHIGVALGRQCIKAGVSVSSIAGKFNVSRQTVYNWFEGRVTPNNRISELIEKYTAILKHKNNNV